MGNLSSGEHVSSGGGRTNIQDHASRPPSPPMKWIPYASNPENAPNSTDQQATNQKASRNFTSQRGRPRKERNTVLVHKPGVPHRIATSDAAQAYSTRSRRCMCDILVSDPRKKASLCYSEAYTHSYKLRIAAGRSANATERIMMNSRLDKTHRSPLR